jgi:hypothetical protein
LEKERGVIEKKVYAQKASKKIICAPIKEHRTK